MLPTLPGPPDVQCENLVRSGNARYATRSSGLTRTSTSALQRVRYADQSIFSSVVGPRELLTIPAITIDGRTKWQVQNDAT